MTHTDAEIHARLTELAADAAARGDLEHAVLAAARAEFGPASLADEQRLVGLWNALFAAGVLVPGRDLGRPDRPHFHLGGGTR